MPMDERAKRVWERKFGSDQEGTDAFGKRIRKADYGEESSKYGWDVDHIDPDLGDGLNESNLRPLNIHDNRGRNN